MRIAVVFSELAPQEGGAHTFQDTLAGALRALSGSTSHEFVLMSAGGTGGATDVVEIPHGGGRRAGRTALRALRDMGDRVNAPRPPTQTWLERELARRKIDIVWFTSHHMEETDLPFVATVWDMEHVQQPWFPEISRGGEWERRHEYFSRFLPKATRIVVSNSAGTDLIDRWFPVGRERFIENPFPTPEFALQAGDGDASVLGRLGVEPGRYLFYPAQFWPHKNHYAALEVLVRIPELTFVATGSDKGWLAHVKQLAADLGVAERVRFPGFVERDELIALYRNAHCLFFPSWFGPENLPPLEAVALGCPAVCADTPGAAEQLGDAALYAAPTDFDALADCVRRLDEPSVRDGLIERGLELARTRTGQAYVARMLEFYDGFEPVLRNWAPSI